MLEIIIKFLSLWFEIDKLCDKLNSSIVLFVLRILYETILIYKLVISLFACLPKLLLSVEKFVSAFLLVETFRHRKKKNMKINSGKTWHNFASIYPFQVFCSMMACTIHCRHLMVWKIFAPRFIYEGLATFISLPAIIFGYLILIRVHWSVSRMINRINKTK